MYVKFLPLGTCKPLHCLTELFSTKMIIGPSEKRDDHTIIPPLYIEDCRILESLHESTHDSQIGRSSLALSMFRETNRGVFYYALIMDCYLYSTDSTKCNEGISNQLELSLQLFVKVSFQHDGIAS